MNDQAKIATILFRIGNKHDLKPSTILENNTPLTAQIKRHAALNAREREGIPVPQIARYFEVSEQTIYNWTAKAREERASGAIKQTKGEDAATSETVRESPAQTNGRADQDKDRAGLRSSSKSAETGGRNTRLSGTAVQSEAGTEDTLPSGLSGDRDGHDADDSRHEGVVGGGGQPGQDQTGGAADAVVSVPDGDEGPQDEAVADRGNEGAVTSVPIRIVRGRSVDIVIFAPPDARLSDLEDLARRAYEIVDTRSTLTFELEH